MFYGICRTFFQTQSGEEAAEREHHGGLLLLWRTHPLPDVREGPGGHPGSVQGAAHQERQLQVQTAEYVCVSYAAFPPSRVLRFCAVRCGTVAYISEKLGRVPK